MVERKCGRGLVGRVGRMGNMSERLKSQPHLDPHPPIPYRPASLAGLLAVDDIELNIAIPAVSLGFAAVSPLLAPQGNGFLLPIRGKGGRVAE